MEKTRICKICNRRFANGKAMGGHMRSHLAKLPLPPKPIPPQETYNTPNKSPSSSSSLNYPLLGNNKPTQSSRSILKQKVSAVSKPTPYDGESETESTTKPTGRRSKRSLKSADLKVAESMAKVTESSEQVSSVSYLLAEEDVALCLLMLSRDHEWSEDAKRVKKEVGECTKDHQYVNHEAESDDEKENYLLGAAQTKLKSQGKYKCETCKRGFRSYQALGGHRASHKKIKTHDEHEEGSGNGCGGGDNHRITAGKRIFKCPFCDKVFDSGQALGGHKKVHFSYLPVTNARISIDLLDLNIPALEGSTHDDGEVSEA
ncbi:zinc finger protein [Salix suchowensis]|nr:zinc finger protein [Salix suchowensis]